MDSYQTSLGSSHPEQLILFIMEVDSHQQQNQHHSQKDDHYLVMHDKTLKCVCELCTCGKHHCPRPRVKGNFTTSYGDTYKNIQLPQAPPVNQNFKYEQRHYNPEALRTSYQDTYVPQKVNNYMDSPSRLQNVGSKLVYHVPFTGSSSYKDQYKPFTILPHHQNQNPEENLGDSRLMRSPTPAYRPPAVKFQGITSYKSQFVQPPKIQAKPPIAQNYSRMQVPFSGSSSYKNDFPEYKIQQKQQIYQNMSAVYRAPHVKFDDHTAYKDSFKGYSLKSPEQEISASRHRCAVENLNIPPVNYLNDKNHIYYDPEQKKFV